MNSCPHSAGPKAVYALPYLGYAKICPTCAVELGNRLKFAPSEDQLRKAVKRVSRDLTNAEIEHIRVHISMLCHYDACNRCCNAEKEWQMCVKGKAIFLSLANNSEVTKGAQR